MSSKRDTIKRFADKRPEARAVFGYGSGVFKQDIPVGKPQTDVIFVVDDIRQWHKDNMSENSGDYSLIGRIHLSGENVDRIKGKNFVTYVSDIKGSEGDTFKYGVVENSDFQRGLCTWDNMFLVGRFHKPILDVMSNETVRQVIAKNRDRAFRVACILSNSVTDKESIFRMLCGLSYMGDARMKIAENPNKVRNIVKGNWPNLENIYKFNEPYVKVLTNGLVLISHEQLLAEILELPECMVDYLAETDTDLKDLEMVRKRILEYVIGHNRVESKAQIVEGLKTNGIVKSIPYAISKVKKKLMK
jgi:translocator assembly and maintenance protein 41